MTDLEQNSMDNENVSMEAAMESVNDCLLYTSPSPRDS